MNEDTASEGNGGDRCASSVDESVVIFWYAAAIIVRRSFGWVSVDVIKFTNVRVSVGGGGGWMCGCSG